LFDPPRGIAWDIPAPGPLPAHVLEAAKAFADATADTVKLALLDRLLLLEARRS
jgi:hypothetical protein